jgi:hypothetical protein
MKATAFLQLAFLLAAALMTGCSSYRAFPKRAVSEAKELPPLVHYFTDDVMAKYRASGDEQGKRAYRAEVVMGRLRAVDLLFLKFEQAINAERNGAQIATDWAVLGLSGAGAATGGTAAKALYAAISGGLTGAKLSLDKALFYEKTMPVLLQAMQASRKAILVEIRQGLMSPLDAYPLFQALNDVDRYYEAGTLPGAVVAINSQTGQKNEKATAKLEQLVEFTYAANQDTAALEGFLFVGPEISPARKTAVEAAMKEAGLAEGTELSDLLYDAKFAQARGKVLVILRKNNKL